MALVVDEASYRSHRCLDHIPVDAQFPPVVKLIALRKRSSIASC